jgi:hypothetical protein
MIRQIAFKNGNLLQKSYKKEELVKMRLNAEKGNSFMIGVGLLINSILSSDKTKLKLPSSNCSSNTMTNMDLYGVFSNH